MEQTLFYFTGSNKGIQVNSRNDILTVLQEEAGNIVEINIVFVNNEYRVLARMKGDASWIGVGRTNKII